LENRPDGEILKEAGIFPAVPMLSESDWLSICNYYKESAPEKPLPQGPRPKIQMGLSQFQVKRIKHRSLTPMTTLVQIDPANKRLYVGDAQAKSLDILNPGGDVLRRINLNSGPVSLTANQDGIYLTLIGHVFPSDERGGQLVFLEEASGRFKVQQILDKLQRPTATTFADLNGDGREDFVVSAFGNYLGRFSWFEKLRSGGYQEHLLFERPGAIRSCVLDANKDGLPDIFVLMAQAKEGIYLFTNQGKGVFREQPLVEFHPLFGSTYFELADFNGDGFLDILATNGDNGEYPSPFKNYHGIRIYLNDGSNHFHEAWFYPLNGAFKAMAADFDHDGDLDIAAISFFPDYEKSPEESFVYLENKGGLKFQAHSFPESTEGRWLTMDVNDIDGDGDWDIVLGSFSQGPQSIPIPNSMQERWNTNRIAVLILENKLR
jgi:FG-GAP-like repeat